MPSFVKIRLSDMVKELGESEVKTILSSFVCDKNEDVQTFIREKAIKFSECGWAKTTLVYWVSDDEKEKYLVGYYTIAPKYICVSKDVVSANLARKLNNHGKFDPNTREYVVPAPLIAQLGKNFADGNNYVIKGDELLRMALDTVEKIQVELGGKFIYLECEEKEKLINFYERNGFTNFGKRKVDRDEVGVDGEYLVQFLKYMK